MRMATRKKRRKNFHDNNNIKTSDINIADLKFETYYLDRNPI